MPIMTIDRPGLPVEMRDALKRHILRERQRKKDEADANEADKQRRREEKAKALSSSKVQLEDNAKDIMELERTIGELQQQKSEQWSLLKRALNEEDRRKQAQQTVSKEPSWTSLYSPNLQMPAYAHHPQHYLSAQTSHRLLAYKPPPPQPSSQSAQAQSFIPTTTATNTSFKRSRSPSSAGHIYSSPSSKSSRAMHAPQMHSRAVSPGATYASAQMARNGSQASSMGYLPSQNSSAFTAYLNYMNPSSAGNATAASYQNQMPHGRAPSQIPNYLNPLSFLPQPIVDPKQQQQQQQQQANAYSHHSMLMSAKNGSIMNGYPIQP